MACLQDFAGLLRSRVIPHQTLPRFMERHQESPRISRLRILFLALAGQIQGLRAHDAVGGNSQRRLQHLGRSARMIREPMPGMTTGLAISVRDSF